MNDSEKKKRSLAHTEDEHETKRRAGVWDNKNV